jgi:Tfp pilus assembly protein PilV
MRQRSSLEKLRAPELDASLRSFYRADRRRARSSERDLGLHWRTRDGESYRAAWVADTGELYAIRHGDSTADGRLSILARVDAQALERELAGWQEVCDSDAPGTYEWLRDRAATAARTRGAANQSCSPALKEDR